MNIQKNDGNQMMPKQYPGKKLIDPMFTRFSMLALGLLLQGICIAQASIENADNQKVQMAEGMRSNGKIYVVVAVLLTVLSGLFIYLYRLDKKISTLEKH